jgi:hypothetical protein
MTPTELNNLPVLANAIQLVSEVALNVIGNDIAAEVDGAKVTQASVKTLAAAYLNQTLAEKTNA